MSLAVTVRLWMPAARPALLAVVVTTRLLAGGGAGVQVSARASKCQQIRAGSSVVMVKLASVAVVCAFWAGGSLMVTTGGWVSIVHCRLSLAPKPTPSWARNVIVCGPSASASLIAWTLIWPGAAQVSRPASNAQQICEASVACRRKSTEALSTSSSWVGPVVMVTVGRTVSMTQLRTTVEPAPIRSRASTAKVAPPLARLPVRTLVVRRPPRLQVGTPLLMRQQNVAASVEVTVNWVLALPETEFWAGPTVMATVGRTVSMVKVRVTVAPKPALSWARTSKVVTPWGRPFCDGLAATWPAAEQVSAPPLNFQQMVELSEEATAKLAVVELRPAPSSGPAVMVTTGRIESTMKLRVRVAPGPTASRA